MAGEKGTFHLWPDKSYVEFYPAAPRAVTRLIGYVRPFWLQERLMRPGFERVRMRIPGPKESGYTAEFREFLSAIAEGRAPATSAEDGRRDLEIVLRAYDSLAAGERVGIGGVTDAAIAEGAAGSGAARQESGATVKPALEFHVMQSAVVHQPGQKQGVGSRGCKTRLAGGGGGDGLLGQPRKELGLVHSARVTEVRGIATCERAKPLSVVSNFPKEQAAIGGRAVAMGV